MYCICISQSKGRCSVHKVPRVLCGKYSSFVENLVMQMIIGEIPNSGNSN